MKTWLRFFFHPSPKDRLFWGCVSTLMTLVTLATTIYLFSVGQLCAAAYNGMMTLWNALASFVAFEVYYEWRSQTKKNILKDKLKIGFYTTFECPHVKGKCDWYGCKKPVSKEGNKCFCEEHGKIKIQGTYKC